MRAKDKRASLPVAHFGQQFGQSCLIPFELRPVFALMDVHVIISALDKEIIPRIRRKAILFSAFYAAIMPTITTSLIGVMATAAIAV